MWGRQPVASVNGVELAGVGDGRPRFASHVIGWIRSGRTSRDHEVSMSDPVLSRRSIRKYTDQPVDDATVERLLRAGMAAPSAGNQQPWKFIVIRDRATLTQIT